MPTIYTIDCANIDREKSKKATLTWFQELGNQKGSRWLTQCFLINLILPL